MLGMKVGRQLNKKKKENLLNTKKRNGKKGEKSLVTEDSPFGKKSFCAFPLTKHRVAWHGTQAVS